MGSERARRATRVAAPLAAAAVAAICWGGVAGVHLPAALAQEPGGGPPPGGGPGGPGGPGGGQRQSNITEIPLPLLETGLRLTQDQEGRIARAIWQFAGKRRQLMPPPGSFDGQSSGPPDPQTMRAMGAQMRTLERQAEAQIDAALTSEQRRQVPALLESAQTIQRAGIPLFLFGRLQLSADQRRQIVQIAESAPDEARKSAAAAQRSDRFGAGVEAAQQAAKQTGERILAILTPEQRDEVESVRFRRPGPWGPGPAGFGGGSPRP